MWDRTTSWGYVAVEATTFEHALAIICSNQVTTFIVQKDRQRVADLYFAAPCVNRANHTRPDIRLRLKVWSKLMQQPFADAA